MTLYILVYIFNKFFVNTKSPPKSEINLKNFTWQQQLCCHITLNFKWHIWNIEIIFKSNHWSLLNTHKTANLENKKTQIFKTPLKLYKYNPTEYLKYKLTKTKLSNTILKLMSHATLELWRINEKKNPKSTKHSGNIMKYESMNM